MDRSIRQRSVPLRLFAPGYSYKVLGLIETNIHLLGPATASDTDRPYLLGTDRLGRDQWSRLMYGTRTSMTVGLVAVILSVILGVLLGGISGYFGGLPDLVIQRVIEILQSLPTIPIWLAMTAALPRDWPPTQVFFAITIILALIGWTTLAARCAAASCRCARRISCWPPSWPAAAACASSRATWCRPS